MIIHRDCYVRLAYRMHLDSGEVVKGSAAGPAYMDFVVGYRELLPGLEIRLLGMREGQEQEFVIPAAEAFGRHDPKQVQEYNRSRFPADADLRPGGVVTVAHSVVPLPFPYRIVEVREDVVVLDMNHPLVDRDLHYWVQVLEVRPATSEELDSRKQQMPCEGNWDVD